MALSDRDIIITPNRGAGSEPIITLRGADAASSATMVMRVINSGTVSTLSYEGTSGQLFAVSDTFTGSIFSVNDVSGIPSLEVLDSGLIKLAEYNGKVQIGGETNNENATSTTTGELQVIGGVGVSRDVYVGGGMTVVGTLNAAVIAGSISNSANVAVTNDPSNGATMYPTFVSATSGNQAIRVDSSGLVWIPSTNRLGIGTTTPVGPLHVVTGSGSSDANTVILQRSATSDYSGISFRTGTTTDWSIGHNSNGGLSIFEAGAAATTRMVVKAGGNVGIGTTAPGSKLHIFVATPAGTTSIPTGTDLLIDSNTNSYLTFRQSADIGAYGGIQWVDNNVGAYIVFRNYTGSVATGSDSIIYGTYQDHIFQAGTNGTVNGKTEVARITSTGRLGIGTNAPDIPLDIRGTDAVIQAREDGTSSAWRARILSRNSSANKASFLGTYASNTGVFAHNYALSAWAPLYVNTTNGSGDGDNVIIAGSGSVGIGNNAPTRKLDVTGVTNVSSHITQGALISRPNVSWGAAGTSTGAVVIKFPGGSGNYGMVHIVIDIYTYDGENASTIIIGGHNWNGSWYNFGANRIGAFSKGVRVAFKDGQYAVVLGTNTSTWSYGQVVVRKIQNGSYYSGIMDLGGTYTITQDAAAESYSYISSNLITAGSAGGGGWNSGNDGSGSGLDADLLDGLDSTAFLRRDVSNSMFAGQGSQLSFENQGTFFRFAFNELRFYDWNNGIDIFGLDEHAYATTSMRAPIFYDRDNTAYYTNPAGNSLMQSITLAQNPTGQAHAGVATQPSFFIGQANGGDDGWKIYGESPSGANTGALILQSEDDYDGNESIRLRFKRTYAPYNTTDSLIAYYNYVQVEGSVRAPIFYDSNNTGFYIDPASTSVLNNLTVTGTTTLSSVVTAGTDILTTNLNSTPGNRGWDLHGNYAMQAIYGNHNPLNSGNVYNAALFRGGSWTMYGFNGSAWVNLGAVPNLTNGYGKANWGGVTLSRAYSEFIIDCGSTFGYTFMSALTLTHSTSGNSMSIYFEKSTSSTYNSGTWSTMASATGVGSWPGGTSIKFSDVVGASYPPYVRLRIIPSWSHPSNTISLGQLFVSAAYGGGNQLLEWDTSYNVTANGSFRAPIFYDSNDTTYYVDPASGTRLGTQVVIAGNASGSAGNRLLVGSTTVNYSLQDTNLRPTIHAHGAYPVLSLNHTVTSNTNHGPTVQFTCNGVGNQFVIGTNGSGTQLDMGYSSNADWNPHNGIAGYLGTTFFRATSSGLIGIGAQGDWGALGGGNPGYAIDTRGTLYNNSDIRAPIFYDANDTGYYTDPASTSVMNNINVAGTIQSTNGNGAVRLYGNLHIDSYNGNDIYLNYYGARRTRAFIGTSEKFRVDTDGIVYAFDQFRTPIIYDNNNTGFYVDPASSSTFKQLRVAAVIQSAQYNNAAIEVREFNYGGVQSDIWENAPRIGFHWGGRVASSIAMSSNGWINIMNNPGTGWENLRANQGLFNSEVTAYYSDVRLKTRVGTLDNAIEKVKAIETFKYVNNELANSLGFTDTLVHVGVSAQSVEAVFPEVVRHAPFDIKVEDGKEISESGEWYKTVQYDKLVPLLIEAIKEQQIIIEQHRAELDELRELKELVKQSLGK